MTNIIFIKPQTAGKSTSNFLSDNQKVPVKTDFESWNKLKPVYFPYWAWSEVCQRSPQRYKMFLPVYQGKKVILT